jgi:UDP-sugar transporter A1/2/3
LEALDSSSGDFDVLFYKMMMWVVQVKGCGETDCRSLLAAPIQGYLFGILSACLSAMAGVYTEFLMKKNQDSLHWQNMQLYV